MYLKNILDYFRLYTFAFIIPILLTIITIVCIILDVKLRYGYLGTFKMAWIDYFFTGNLLGIKAWRIHIVLILFSAFSELQYRLR